MLVRSVIGAFLALLALIPVILGARALRRRVMPALDGAMAVLAEIVLDLVMVVGTAEVLGTVGLFALVPVTVALAAVGIGAVRFGRSVPGRPDEIESPSPEPGSDAATDSVAVTPRWWRGASIFAVSLVSAEWMTRVVDSWHRGMTTTDSLWYHLPMAARFVQEGWTSRLHFVDSHSLIVFYPETSELLHATGMVFLGNDTLSLVVNLGWLAFGLLGAWCIGRRFGVSHLTLIGAAVVFATPQLVLDDAGSGLNDVVAIALFLAAVALVLNAARPEVAARERRAEMICGALAAGLAAGTKYTLVLPAVALALGVLWLTPRGERIRFVARWCGVVFLAGGYWYVRNLIATGNPVPTARFGLGPVHLPSLPFPGTSSIVHFAFRGDVWKSYFFPGLNSAFGPVWWAIALVGLAGIAFGAVRSDDRPVRVLALLGFLSFVGFAVTPQILGGRVPIYFEPNARYVAPALVLGTIVLPIVWRRSTRVLSALIVAYLVVLVATQFANTVWAHTGSGYAPVTVGAMPNVVAIAFGLVMFVGALAWTFADWHLPRHGRRPGTVFGVAVAILVVGVAGVGVEQYALSHRYRHVEPMPSIYRWAQGIHHARIATVNVTLQYPLYGKDLSNYVQYVAVRHSDKESTTINDCATWRRAINQGKYRYVLAAAPSYPFPSKQPAREEQWTRSDPAAHLLLTDSRGKAHVWLFEIRGALDPGGCPGTG